MRHFLLGALLLCVVPMIGKAQDYDTARRANSISRLTKADSVLAIESYWMARRHAAGIGMVTGGGLLVVGGVAVLATPSDGSTVLRTGGILLAGAGAVLLPVSAVQRHSLRLSRLNDLLFGRRPVPKGLWQRAIEHQRRKEKNR